jgi:anti-sigma B factor antagonist
MTEQLCSLEAHDLGGGVVVLTLVGEIDLSNVADVEAQIRHGAEHAGRTRVVIDVTGVTYFDSAAFATFERLARRMPAMLVLPSTAPLHRAVEISGIKEILPIFESVDDALGAP